jgi:hypothetical protein
MAQSHYDNAHWPELGIRLGSNAKVAEIVQADLQNIRTAQRRMLDLGTCNSAGTIPSVSTVSTAPTVSPEPVHVIVQGKPAPIMAPIGVAKVPSYDEVIASRKLERR